jgi:Leucine-rich repeat (LRR) protein
MKQSIVSIIFVLMGMATYAQDTNEVEQITMTLKVELRWPGLVISIQGDRVGTAVIDWGDGEIDNVRVSSIGDRRFRHSYDTLGIYTVTITGGNISHLDIKDQRLINLDVSKSPNLKKINCAFNRLTVLDMSKNIKLTDLDCHFMELTSLDVSKNIKLTNLNCCDNRLTSLDVSNNIELTNLNCSGNRLTSLDVSNNIELTNLVCSGNRLLTSLDISQNTALQELSANFNRLTSLDASNNTELILLNCINNDFSTTALNALFVTLPNRDPNRWYKYKRLYVYNNPGADNCDRRVAEEKGWFVTYYDPSLE